MPKSNIVITYCNLHPSDETKSFVDSVIKEIHLELPPTSTIKVSFSAKDDVVKGILQVGSYHGPLFASAASTNVKEIALRLLEQMRRRVDKFKSKSNRRSSIKDLKVNEDSFITSENMQSFIAS